MQIKVYGLPGSGKTYLASSFEDIDSYELVTLRSSRERKFRAFLFSIFHFRSFVVFLGMTIYENFRFPRLLRHKLILFIEAIALEQKGLGIDNAVVDKGLTPYLLSIYERPITESDLKPFVLALNFGHPVIYIINASDQVRIDRMKKRGRVPRSKFGPTYTKKIHRVFSKNNQIITNFLGKNFSSVVINNEKSTITPSITKSAINSY